MAAVITSIAAVAGAVLYLGLINTAAVSEQAQLRTDRPQISQPAEDFGAFWAASRTALLLGDERAIEQMTCLPLKIRGVLDGEPIRRVTGRAMQSAIQRALHADSGLSARNPMTNRALIERSETRLGPAPGIMVSSEF